MRVTSLARSTPVAAAVVGIAIVPAVIGEVTITQQPPDGTSPQQAKAPAPREASVTVPLAEEERDGDSSAYLWLRARGPAPTDQATLTSTDGLDPVDVNRAQLSECKDKGLPLHRVLSEGINQQWCLRLTDLKDGIQVSGKVSGPGTVLTLTVTQRESFVESQFPWIWTRPFGWTLSGLVIGLLVSVVPRWLRRGARAELLDDALDRNDRLGTSSKINDLREWVGDRLVAGDEPDALVVLVTNVMRRGPGRARKTRQRLGAALRDANLPDRFRAKATEVAAKTGHEAADFLKPDGKEVDQHPAEPWLDAVRALGEQVTELNRLEAAIDGLPPALQGDPRKKLADARATLETVDDPTEAQGLTAAVRAVDQAVQAAKHEAAREAAEEAAVLAGNEAEPVEPRLDGAEVLKSRPRFRRPRPRAAEPGGPGLGWIWAALKWPFKPLRLITFAIIVLSVAWAVLVIEQTLYEPKPAFGSTEDYLALVIGAVGSGAAGAVLGLLAIWDPTEPVEKS